MPTIDLNIIIPALLAFMGVASTACCSSFFPFVAVVSTAWLSNRAAHNRHAKTSEENREIIDKATEVKWSVEQQKQFSASRFDDLQRELNDCKNALARRVPPVSPPSGRKE